ncbi:MAG: nuclear transport factor 2 family protein [Verrucomicrobiota bacterium]
MPATEQEIKDVLNTWIETVGKANGDADAVLPLYAPDAVLLATFSSRVRCQSAEDLRGYFTYFTGLPGLRGRLDEVEVHADPAGSLAACSGFYTFFHQGTPDGSEAEAPARFTFVYRKGEDGKLLIVEHHSSVMPEERADAK